uniref:Uncharacterized protein n=1 Tax=Anguilla anguilla TaxID=7936 RepID=A0A0E9TRM0_ANGAN
MYRFFISGTPTVTPSTTNSTLYCCYFAVINKHSR